MSEVNLTQAADDIRNMLRPFKQFERVIAALENLGSFDQMMSEKRTIISDYDAEITVKRNEVLALKQACVQAEMDAEAIRQRGNENASRVLDEAADAAAQLLTSADAAAATKAKAAIDEAARIVGMARDKAMEFDAKRAEAEGKLKELNVQVDAQNSELTRVTQAVAAARAKMYEIMGDKK